MPKENETMEIKSLDVGSAQLTSRTKARTVIRLHDGTTLIGTLSTGPGYHRVSDYLNDEKTKQKDFIVLVDTQNKAHMINKRYIVTVVEEG